MRETSITGLIRILFVRKNILVQLEDSKEKERSALRNSKWRSLDPDYLPQTFHFSSNV